jgi:hypothetical protein
LWWREHEGAVLLVPLVSWVTPANVFEGGLLVPSLRYCQQHWGWWPKIIVADMSYMGAQLKALCRTRWQTAVVTRLHSNAQLIPPYAAWNRTQCHQGQPLRWLEYAPEQDQHWFGVAEPAVCCSRCWEASTCPRQFAFAASQHETLFGLLPLASLPVQRLLQQVRPWIEPAQSYEKNQLGLNSAFLNSLHLAWCMALLADAAVLLRIRAMLEAPARTPLLHDLLAHQSQFDFGPRMNSQNAKSQKMPRFAWRQLKFSALTHGFCYRVSTVASIECYQIKATYGNYQQTSTERNNRSAANALPASI